MMGFLKIFTDIVSHFQDNSPRPYSEPSADLYDAQFYSDLYTPSDKIDYLLRLCSLKSGHRILDIGCGRGELVSEVARRGSYECIGIEYSQTAVDLALKKAEQNRDFPGTASFLRMDCTQLKFSDNFFDYVMMADIVEHLNEKNLSEAISEAFRVLKPGGSLVIHTEPTVSFKRFGQYFVQYYFEKKGIPWMSPTIRQEALRGHVNIQSKNSLERYLGKSFSSRKVRVFYGPIHAEGGLKKGIKFFRLWAIFSPHLWAVAVK